VSGTCGMHGRGEECVQGFDGKTRRKETTWKTVVLMVRRDQNGSYGDWLGKYGLYPIGLGW
jgi:hypothetical protein